MATHLLSVNLVPIYGVFLFSLVQIIEELRSNGINIYQFPTDDESVLDLNRKMNDQVPFAVVGSREEIVVNGTKTRARKYPWGTVEGVCVCVCTCTFVRQKCMCEKKSCFRVVVVM